MYNVHAYIYASRGGRMATGTSCEQHCPVWTSATGTQRGRREPAPDFSK